MYKTYGSSNATEKYKTYGSSNETDIITQIRIVKTQTEMILDELRKSSRQLQDLCRIAREQSEQEEQF